MLLSPVSGMSEVHGDEGFGKADQTVFGSGVRREDKKSPRGDQRAFWVSVSVFDSSEDGSKWLKGSKLFLCFFAVWRRMCLSLCVPWRTPPCLAPCMSSSHVTASWFAAAWRRGRDNLGCALMIPRKGKRASKQASTQICINYMHENRFDLRGISKYPTARKLSKQSIVLIQTGL